MTNSPALDQPLRDKRDVALEAAVMALRFIERTTRDTDAADWADEALCTIKALVPEIEE